MPNNGHVPRDAHQGIEFDAAPNHEDIRRKLFNRIMWIDGGIADRRRWIAHNGILLTLDCSKQHKTTPHHQPKIHSQINTGPDSIKESWLRLRL